MVKDVVCKLHSQVPSLTYRRRLHVCIVCVCELRMFRRILWAMCNVVQSPTPRLPLAKAECFIN